MKKITKEQENDIRALILDLSVLKSRAMEIKMYRTGHLLDEALSHAGWELARLIDDSSGEPKPLGGIDENNRI